MSEMSLPGNSARPPLAVAVRSRAEVEYLRIISAFGLVCYHAEIYGAELGYAGLISFLLISIYFSGSSKPKHPVDRAIRLLVPWAFWFALYTLLKLFIGRPVWIDGASILTTVLSGGHLWYLPFAFLVLCAIDWLRRHVSLQVLGILGGVLAVATLLSAPLWRSPSMALGAPWSQYAHAAAAVFAGVFLMGAGALPRSVQGLLVFLVSAAALVACDVRGVGLPYFVGFLAMAAVVLLPSSFWNSFKMRRGVSFSQYSFGIYLIHPMFLAIALRLGFDRGWYVPVVAFFLSAICVKALQIMAPRYHRYIV